MIVTCESCRARYRLGETLLKDSKGARLRCRKCGGTIVVMSKTASAAAPAVEPPPAPVPEKPAERTPSPPEPLPAAPTPPRKVEPVPEPRPAWSGRSGPDPLDRLLELRDVLPPPPARQERKVAAGRPSRSRVPFIAAGVLIVALAGIALYYGTTEPGKMPFGMLLSSEKTPPPGGSTYDIRDLSGQFDKGMGDENLFVIRGTVANTGKGYSDGIRIRATLLGKDNEVLGKKETFAGNVLDNTALRHMHRDGIESFLTMRDGDGLVNRDIPPGKSLPFMVIFFAPPERTESFKVKAIDAW